MVPGTRQEGGVVGVLILGAKNLTLAVAVGSEKKAPTKLHWNFNELLVPVEGVEPSTY